MNPRNKIVVYQGGGFSGCVTEPNAFMFDNSGQFCNLIATGCDGIKDETTALKMYKSIKDKKRRRKHLQHFQ